jgi:poly(beta-D-mannuronate) lyase
MLRIVFSLLILSFNHTVCARTILVADAAALKTANNGALPGDTIVLKDGEWGNINILLNCKGTAEAPIVVKAQTQGKVLINGNSKLRIGGSFIIVDGLYFLQGYSGSDAVITFRSNKTEVANNCRVTNTVVNDFNNPKRLAENYWVALYGKKNRLDHCSFLNKKNIGVLLAVILDDDRSRENFHSIDHNYFGTRLPLASNGGEIIRVGVSDHCGYNSNTQIADNFFEHCDGETEIISIKSCQNTVRNNIFKECQGSVVLRHGNYNTVEGNLFFGNDKKGTGGVRIINKGQWVVNNFFFRCRGEGFRSPLSIMNGVPNSPANRYLEVSEAVICNNRFFECSPMGFCVGSDTERSVTPCNVQFLNNIFFNRTDSLLYHAYDNIGGISFSGNLVSNTIGQQLTGGFKKISLTDRKHSGLLISGRTTAPVPDSLIRLSSERLLVPFPAKPVSNEPGTIPPIPPPISTTSPPLSLFEIASKGNNTSIAGYGAKWLSRVKRQPAKAIITVSCKTAAAVKQALKTTGKSKLVIDLTGTNYAFDAPVNISHDITFTASKKQRIQWSLAFDNAPFLMQVTGGGKLTLNNLSLDLAAAKATAIITTDTSGSSNHYNFFMQNCRITNCDGNFFSAAKSSVADSIIVNKCIFSNGKGIIFKLDKETDKKGYYNAELIKISNCTFTGNTGQVLTILRTGNDESTMGPLLRFSGNSLTNCSSTDGTALMYLYGVQYTTIEKNIFYGCNEDGVLLQYQDAVSSWHLLGKNKMVKSGRILTNKFVQTQK